MCKYNAIILQKYDTMINTSFMFIQPAAISYGDRIKQRDYT